MTTYETAWAAGLFEGEGYARCRPNHGNLEVKIDMTDFDVLEKIHRLIPNSILRGPYRRLNYKPKWTWVIYGKPAIPFLQRILPYLGKRRTIQVTEAIQTYTIKQTKIRVEE